MGLYLPNGFVNMRSVIGCGCPFIIVMGGRGTGKTYGALEAVLQDRRPFVLMRRTDKQIGIITKPEFSPFAPINRSHGWNYGAYKIGRDQYGIAQLLEDGKPDGEAIGFAIALSTFANVRGINADAVEIIIHDEVIPEKHEKAIKDEGDALLNAYETINRNRELQGRPPLIYLGMTNANRPDSPIFDALKISRQLERMQARHQTCSIMRDRGIALYNLADSPISQRKAQTALYQATQGSDFAKMAIENDYGGDRSQVRPSPLAEYRPIVQIGQLCIYRHKSRRELYASTHVTGSPPVYGTDDMELRRFVRDHADIWRAQLERRVFYETYTDEIYLTNLFT